jgi:hypothetical protein
MKKDGTNFAQFQQVDDDSADLQPMGPGDAGLAILAIGGSIGLLVGIYLALAFVVQTFAR